MCTPADKPEVRVKETNWARRPDRMVASVCTTPSAWSCLTRLEMVAGDNPVTAASSTWVI